MFLENVILKVSQTHFSKDFYPKGRGPMPPPPLASPRGGITFSRGRGTNCVVMTFHHSVRPRRFCRRGCDFYVELLTQLLEVIIGELSPIVMSDNKASGPPKIAIQHSRKALRMVSFFLLLVMTHTLNLVK